MSEIASVVTAARFEQGAKSFNEWLEMIDIREDQFQRNYDEYIPEENHLHQLQELVNTHGIKALVLGEAWCPDVWRGLPVISKLSEATGMQARYFLKDENQDIMSEFLNGEFESIRLKHLGMFTVKKNRFKYYKIGRRAKGGSSKTI